uniref:Uncharacterized protein n=1 Tax=Podoviridae sp. ctZkC8 TaxID=2825259 RepID=A0A8S5UBL7_9CAUD|nr:MAG TPA: hypothetical protein [Podoviridae sp. ctZkC8]
MITYRWHLCKVSNIICWSICISFNICSWITICSYWSCCSCIYWSISSIIL